MATKEYTLKEIHAAAEWLWQLASGKKIIALHGEMGAGKTTLVHALCNYLRVPDVVSSPTFSIINQYGFPSNHILYHIDLYRLNNRQDVINAGIEDCLYSGEYCIVEWPERAAGLLPDDTLHAHISIVDCQKRKIEIR